jgi:TolA-binding protein
MALEVASEKARSGLFDQALSDLVPLIVSGVDSAIEKDALFLRARIEEAQKRFGDAQATYTEIKTRFDDAPTRARAGYMFGRAAVDSGAANRRTAAMRAFLEVASIYPQTEYAPRALAAVAALQSAAKNQTVDAELGKRVPTAFVTSRDLIARYPDDEVAERAYWLVGETFDDLKLYQEAVGAFSQLVARFPGTELEAWWRIGQLYDRRLDDRIRAIDAYRHVPESSQHHSAAQKRINRLSR